MKLEQNTLQERLTISLPNSLKILDLRYNLCIAGRPNTKGKVEAPMKLLDEIHAYQGRFTFEELHEFVQKLCARINQTFHQGTGKIPVFALKQEKKNLLQPLPKSAIRDSYMIKHKLVKLIHQA
jgi:hypothetical protein